MKIEIVKTYIENDLRNDSPTIVYLDENGQEWVHEEQSSQHAGYITALVKKENSWYWRTDE